MANMASSGLVNPRVDDAKGAMEFAKLPDKINICAKGHFLGSSMALFGIPSKADPETKIEVQTLA